MLSKLLLYFISIYVNIKSEFFPHTLGTCKFYPCCSRYAREAIKKYGPFKGTYLSIRRILRCSPFSKGGYDPLK